MTIYQHWQSVNIKERDFLEERVSKGVTNVRHNGIIIAVQIALNKIKEKK